MLERSAVAVVDQQPLWRAGMERLIQEDPALAVVASVGSVEELDSFHVRFDVVVLDMPAAGDGSALAVIARLAEVSRPIAISAWDTAVPSLVAAIRAGACACVSRQSDRSEVTAALRVVAQGGFYVCRGLHDRFHNELAGSPRQGPNGLAPREVETLRWIARGFTQGQIANRMGVTQATVNTYAKRIRAKLGATNKAELTRLAIELGHLTDDPVADPAG